MSRSRDPPHFVGPSDAVYGSGIPAIEAHSFPDIFSDAAIDDMSTSSSNGGGGFAPPSSYQHRMTHESPDENRSAGPNHGSAGPDQSSAGAGAGGGTGHALLDAAVAAARASAAAAPSRTSMSGRANSSAPSPAEAALPNNSSSGTHPAPESSRQFAFLEGGGGSGSFPSSHLPAAHSTQLHRSNHSMHQGPPPPHVVHAAAIAAAASSMRPGGSSSSSYGIPPHHGNGAPAAVGFREAPGSGGMAPRGGFCGSYGPGSMGAGSEPAGGGSMGVGSYAALEPHRFSGINPRPGGPIPYGPPYGPMSSQQPSSSPWMSLSMGRDDDMGGPDIEDRKVVLDKRRSERNMREQKRSHKITEQISTLRNILQLSGVTCKGNKFSVLTTAAEYIQELQCRTDSLDKERLHFISQLKSMERVSVGNILGMQCGVGGGAGSVVQGSGASSTVASSTGASSTASSSCGGDDRLLASDPQGIDASGAAEPNSDQGTVAPPTGIDYSHVFRDAAVGMAVTTVDGRFIECNKRFEEESGYSKAELQQLTVFNLTPTAELQSTFALVAQMLNAQDADVRPFVKRANLKNNDEHLWISVSLIRDLKGTPRHFHCVFIGGEDP